MPLAGLVIGLTFPVGMAAIGAVYAVFFDPKSALPRGSWRRLL